ncbi:unnamed protein product [Amoebophrya sp. A120]|nr:unnamed protein product [Amoebophrya sp. A120]|eukprot:GSA120T00025837001.1
MDEIAVPAQQGDVDEDQGVVLLPQQRVKQELLPGSCLSGGRSTRGDEEEKEAELRPDHAGPRHEPQLGRVNSAAAAARGECSFHGRGSSEQQYKQGRGPQQPPDDDDDADLHVNEDPRHHLENGQDEKEPAQHEQVVEINPPQQQDDEVNNDEVESDEGGNEKEESSLDEHAKELLLEKANQQQREEDGTLHSEELLLEKVAHQQQRVAHQQQREEEAQEQLALQELEDERRHRADERVDVEQLLGDDIMANDMLQEEVVSVCSGEREELQRRDREEEEEQMRDLEEERLRALATEEQERQYWADSPEEREVDNSAVLQRRREGNNFQEEERLGAEAEEQQEEDQLQEYIQEPGRRHYDVSEGTSRGQRPVPRGGRTTEDERVQSACGQQLLPSVVDPAAPPSNEGAGAAGTNIISKSSQELFLNRNQSHLLGQNMLVTPGAKVGTDKNHGNPNQNSSLRPNASPLDPLSKLSSIERASSCHRLLSPIYEQEKDEDKDEDAERLFGEQIRVSPVASGERRGVEQEEIQRQERANRDDLIGKNSLKINRSYVGGELPAAGAAAAPGAAGAFSVSSSRVHLLRAQDVAAAGQHEDQADHRNKNCGRREFFPQVAEGKVVHQNNRRGTTTNGQNENDVVDLDVVLDDQAGSSKKRQDEMAPQLSEQRERRSAPQQMSCSSTMNKARRREVGHLSRIGEHQESGKFVKKNTNNVEQHDRPTTAASRGGLAHKNQRGNGTTEGENLRREEELPARNENRRRQEQEHQKQIRLDNLHGQQELQNHGDPAAKRRRVLNIQGCTTGALGSSSNFVNLANSSTAARGAGSHQKANNSGDGLFVPSRHGGEDNHNSTASRGVAHEQQLEHHASSNAFALVPVRRAAPATSYSHINNKSTGTSAGGIGNSNSSSSSSNLSSTFAKYLKVLEKLDLDFIGTTTTSSTSTCKMNTGAAAQKVGAAGSSFRGYNQTAFGRAGREEPGAGPASAAAQGPPGGPAPPPCSQMTKKSKLFTSTDVGIQRLFEALLEEPRTAAKMLCKSLAASEHSGHNLLRGSSCATSSASTSTGVITAVSKDKMEFYLQSLPQEKTISICRALEDEILGRRRSSNNNGENYDFHGELVVPETGADTEEEGELVDGFVFKILCLVFYTSVRPTLTTREQRREAANASRSAQNKDSYISAGRGRGGKEAPEQLHRGDEKQRNDGHQRHGHDHPKVVPGLVTDEPAASFSLNFLWNWEVLAKVVKALAKEDFQENQTKSASSKAHRSTKTSSLPSVRETLRELFLHDDFQSTSLRQEAEREEEMMPDGDIIAMEIDSKEKDRSSAAMKSKNSVTKINTAPLFLLALEKEIEHAATSGQMRQSSSCGASGGAGRAPRICSSNLPARRGRQNQNSKSLHLPNGNGNMNSINPVQHLASEDEQEELSESSSSSSRTTQQDSQSSNQRNKDQQQKFQRGAPAQCGSSRGDNERGTTTKAALSRSKAATARPEHVLTCLEYYIREFCCGSEERSSSSSSASKVVGIADLERLKEVLRVLFGKEEFEAGGGGARACCIAAGTGNTNTKAAVLSGRDPACSNILAIRDQNPHIAQQGEVDQHQEHQDHHDHVQEHPALLHQAKNSTPSTGATKISQFQLELILGMLGFKFQVKMGRTGKNNFYTTTGMNENGEAAAAALSGSNILEVDFYDFLLTEMKFPLREFFEKLLDDYYQEGLEQLRLLRRHDEGHEDGDDYEQHPHADHPILPDRTSGTDGVRGRTRNDRDEIQILPQSQMQIAHICRAFLKQKKTAVRMLGLELLIPRLEKFSVFSSVCYETVVGLIEIQLHEFEINMRLEEERPRGLLSPGGTSRGSKRRKVAAASSLGGQNLGLSSTSHSYPTHSKVVLSHQLQTNKHEDIRSRQRGGDHHHTRADDIQTAAVREGGPAPHLGDANHDPTTSTGELFCVANQVQEFLSRVVGLLHLDMVARAAGSFSAAGSTLSSISATSWSVLLEILVKAKSLFRHLQHGTNLISSPRGTGSHVVSKSCKNRDRRREAAKYGDHHDVCSPRRSALWLSELQRLITEKGVAVLQEAVEKTTATSSSSSGATASRRKSLLPAQQPRRGVAGGENNCSMTNKLRIFDYRKADSDSGCRADEQAENCPDPASRCGHAEEHLINMTRSLSLIRHFDTGLQHVLDVLLFLQEEGGVFSSSDPRSPFGRPAPPAALQPDDDHDFHTNKKLNNKLSIERINRDFFVEVIRKLQDQQEKTTTVLKTATIQNDERVVETLAKFATCFLDSENILRDEEVKQCMLTLWNTR